MSGSGHPCYRRDETSHHLINFSAVSAGSEWDLNQIERDWIDTKNSLGNVQRDDSIPRLQRLKSRCVHGFFDHKT